MLSWSSFNQYSAHYSFQDNGCFPTKPLFHIVETMGGCERGMNPLAMTIISGRKNYTLAGGRTGDLFSSPDVTN